MLEKIDLRLSRILAQREWQIFECKRASIRPSDLMETVIAFANSDGGTIVVGLEDPKKATGTKRLIGIEENSDNISAFMDLLNRNIIPSLINFSKTSIRIININGVQDCLILFHIAKSNDVHSLINGDTFVRKGNRNVKIGAEEIVRLKYEKGSLSFEKERTNINSLDELDSSLLNQYKKDNSSEEIDDWQFLKDNGLAEKSAKSHYLNKAGALLFCKNPAITLGEKCSIKISHYYGTVPTYSGEPNLVSKPYSIEGPLIYQITETIKQFREITKRYSPKLSGSLFKTTFLVPEFAFQEAITNAVVHRNYSIPNDIQVRFFDDRVEVESPGSFPGFITVANIRSERYPRNPLIQRTLNRFSNAPNLDIGEGVDRIYKVMLENNLYDPLYLPPSQTPHSVVLKLFNQQKVEYWETISNYLEENYKITNSEAKKITGIKDSPKMSRMFTSWVNKGLLEKVSEGYRGSTYYRKPGIEYAVSFANDDANDKG